MINFASFFNVCASFHFSHGACVWIHLICFLGLDSCVLQTSSFWITKKRSNLFKVVTIFNKFNIRFWFCVLHTKKLILCFAWRFLFCVLMYRSFYCSWKGSSFEKPPQWKQFFWFVSVVKFLWEVNPKWGLCTLKLEWKEYKIIENLRNALL